MKPNHAPDKIAARFWKKVRKGDGCWLWIGARSSYSKYGMFSYKGHNIHAHRAAWQITHGELNDRRVFVLHRCYNGHLGCVRPDHLYLGDYKQNGIDTVVSGRSTGVLKPDQVRQVRRMLKTMGQTEIARKFGVSNGVIHGIAKRGNYRHIA